jgi:putative sterol carrier protein
VTKPEEESGTLSYTGSVDPSAVDPDEFARNIGGMKDDELREAMEGPLREQIIGEIFKRMEQHYRGGAGQSGVIHWRITGRPDDGEDHWEAVIADGACATSPEPTSEPRVTLKLTGVDFLKLVTGNASGPMMFMRRRLKIDGDLMFSAQIQSMFAIPEASGR